ncbi:MAG: hypothetical protein ACLGGX_01905 [Bdellovibrionia bacterium]
MMKSLLMSLVLGLSINAQAAPSVVDVITSINESAIMSQAETQALDWKVGDTNNYNIDMGFIKGTMVMSVRSIGADGIWMDQNMDLGFAGKQQVQILMDPNTGEIKKMIVNGQEQTPPEQDVEVIEVKESKVTVPAGTFDAIHARLKDKQQNQEINMWMNPQAIPLSGMLKTVQPSQLGQVTIVLKSFKKN